MKAAELTDHRPSQEALRTMAAITGESRRLTKGLSVFGVHFALYVATLVGALARFPAGVSLIFALANGVFIALLFIIGHDGGHNSFVPGTAWNRWLGRVAFVPCVHALSLWRVVHNERHHARTNLKGVDGVWVPMSPEEYRHASSRRRMLERIYRSPAGPLIYYYVEFWLHRVLFPLAPELRKHWKHHLADSAFAFFGFLFTLSLIAAGGKFLSPGRSLLHIFLFGWTIPFAVWNYLMAFTIYLNHTHPAIPWFDDEDSWIKHRSLAPHTASVKMPVNIAPLYTKVMAHTSHHVQTGVPVYVLPQAEDALRSGYSQLLEYRLGLRGYLHICRTCKLFDYQRMCWTDFAGAATAWPLGFMPPKRPFVPQPA